MSLTASMDWMGVSPQLCPRCGRVVTVAGGRPWVGAGRIELWHDTCWDVHNESVEITIIEAMPERRARKLPRVVMASAGAAAVAIACWFSNGEPPTASLASIDLGGNETLALRAETTEQEVPPDALDPLQRYPIPTVRGTRIDVTYPTLTQWKHPVVKTDLLLPLLPTGHFGAERDGVQRRGCGRGHCGSDINGPIGRPIVAVADGTVITIEQLKNGKDGHSGRYVRIEHEDGSITSYMHLNSIKAGLDKGDHVLAGQQIGTLGRTGIKKASPHLHLGLELPNIPNQKNAKSTHYIDAAPFLVRAQVIDAPDRRRTRKPAS